MISFQKELLSEMIEEGVTAVLIKVAAIGLGREHPGKTLKEVKENDSDRVLDCSLSFLALSLQMIHLANSRSCLNTMLI